MNIINPPNTPRNEGAADVPEIILLVALAIMRNTMATAIPRIELAK